MKLPSVLSGCLIAVLGEALQYPEGVYRSHPGGENWIDMVCNFSRTEKTVDINIRCKPNAPYFGGHFSIEKFESYQDFGIVDVPEYKMMLKEYNDNCGPLKADARKHDLAVFTYITNEKMFMTTLDDLAIPLYPDQVSSTSEG